MLIFFIGKEPEPQFADIAEAASASEALTELFLTPVYEAGDAGDTHDGLVSQFLLESVSADVGQDAMLAYGVVEGFTAFYPDAFQAFAFQGSSVQVESEAEGAEGNSTEYADSIQELLNATQLSEGAQGVYDSYTAVASASYEFVTTHTMSSTQAEAVPATVSYVEELREAPQDVVEVTPATVTYSVTATLYADAALSTSAAEELLVQVAYNDTESAHSSADHTQLALLSVRFAVGEYLFAHDTPNVTQASLLSYAASLFAQDEVEGEHATQSTDFEGDVLEVAPLSASCAAMLDMVAELYATAIAFVTHDSDGKVVAQIDEAATAEQVSSVIADFFAQALQHTSATDQQDGFKPAAQYAVTIEEVAHALDLMRSAMYAERYVPVYSVATPRRKEVVVANTQAAQAVATSGGNTLWVSTVPEKVSTLVI